MKQDATDYGVQLDEQQAAGSTSAGLGEVLSRVIPRPDATVIHQYRYVLKLEPGEVPLLLVPTNTPAPQGKLAGFLPTNLTFLATDRQIMVFAVDKKGGSFSDRFRIENLQGASAKAGLLQHSLELDADGRKIEYLFLPAKVAFVHLDALARELQRVAKPAERIEESEAYKDAYAAASKEVDRLAASARSDGTAVPAAPPAKGASPTTAQKWLGVGCLCAIIFGIVGMCIRGDKGKDGGSRGGGGDEDIVETTQLDHLVQGQECTVSGWYPASHLCAQCVSRYSAQAPMTCTHGYPGHLDLNGVSHEPVSYDVSAHAQSRVALSSRDDDLKCVLRLKEGSPSGDGHRRRVYAKGKYAGRAGVPQWYELSETIYVPFFDQARILKEVRVIEKDSLVGLKKGEVYAMRGTFENRVDQWFVVRLGPSAKFAFCPTSDLRGLTTDRAIWVEGAFAGYQQFTTVLGAQIDAPCLEEAEVKWDW